MNKENVCMIKVVSGCVDCGLPCVDGRCPYYRVPELYCDKCHEEVEILYDYEGKQYCEECILEATKIHFDI